MFRLIAWLLAIYLFGLAGCAYVPTDTSGSVNSFTVVAENERFIWLRVSGLPDYAAMAEKYLGGQQHQWQIRELNGDGTAGGVVVIPKKPINTSSVFADGIRTIPILCYHQFTQGDQTSQRLEISARAFRQQLQFLRDQNYVVLSLDDVASILDGKQSIPERAVVLTIDDGYRSVYDIAWPIIREFGFHTTLYIYTDFVGGGKALTWQQMREMQASGLIDIQSHAKSHTSLSRLPTDKDDAGYKKRVVKEVTESAGIFAQRLGAAPDHLSYPYGNSSKLAADVLRDAGYASGTTVTRGDNTVYSNRFLLHRTMIYDNHSLADFAKFIDNFNRLDLR